MNPPATWLQGIFLLVCANPGFTQSSQPVQWRYHYSFLSNHELLLTLNARIAPGWHLYSQCLEEGGPMPTRISFDPSNDYVLTGKTEEKGNAVTFHDDTYEMEITWYTSGVSFLQKISALQPATIRWRIEYMTCNEHLCVPQKQNFSVDVVPPKKSP